MHYAAINGHSRLVENLVTRGYKVDARDSVCLTYFCCLYQYYDTQEAHWLNMQ